MVNVESISKSIQSKRNGELDSQNFPILKLKISDYDIRKNRARNPKLKDDLRRDGQLQPITVSKNDETFTIVNGRTRYLEMMDLYLAETLFNFVKIEVYEDLTELEQNYLNAQINISQTPLTADEKVEFVIKYKDVLDSEDLGKALGLSKEMVKNYIAVAGTSIEAREAFAPKCEGYGRSDIKVEELGKLIRKAKKEGITLDTEELVFLGKKSEDLDLRRDEKRLHLPKIIEKYAKFRKNENLTGKFTKEELIDIAEKESSDANHSGDKLPLNSTEKYKIVDNLIKTKEKYDFAVLLFAESLYRLDQDGNQIESETKRIIDKIDDIIVIGNEIEKLSDIEVYAISIGKKITIINEDAIEACDS